MRENYRDLRIAILGGGTVGAQVAHRLLEAGDELGQRSGAGLELIGVAVRDLKAERSAPIPAALLTTDAQSLLVGADIVVELMGGIEPARSLILQALQSGADVITANKALLAEHGPELFAAAAKVGAQLYYEAAVAAAIPIIRPLRDSLAGDHVRKIMGIVNGTTNYILDEMDTKGLSFDQALKAASDLGYAEADPTADIEGYDAAQKACILSSLAFHTAVPLADVYREGITDISASQMDAAKRSGHVIKLLAICERLVDPITHQEGVSTRVHPTLIPRDHPLAAAHGANNAVYVEAEAAGPLMFYGAGAGGLQTASAVLGDIVSAARRHVVGGPGVGESTHAGLPSVPLVHVESRLQISVIVIDQPGVLAAIAGVFSEHDVSVETLHQSGAMGPAGSEQTATLVIQTHLASEARGQATIEALEKHPVVVSIAGVLRVEG
ncbi:MAG TPA: homoserine dehydrogenase [Microbacteriaceae bacterium]|nr:homoserine dehydrogenase [Microbacteriaceae bacterium]